MGVALPWSRGRRGGELPGDGDQSHESDGAGAGGDRAAGARGDGRERGAGGPGGRFGRRSARLRPRPPIPSRSRGPTSGWTRFVSLRARPKMPPRGSRCGNTSPARRKRWRRRDSRVNSVRTSNPAPLGVSSGPDPATAAAALRRGCVPSLFRIKHVRHEELGDRALREAWCEWPGMRDVAASPTAPA